MPYRAYFPTLRTSVFGALLVAFFPVPSAGQQASEQQPTSDIPEVRDKSVELFDGKSLGDWKVTEFGTGRPVTIADGAIEMEEGYPLTGITYGGDVPKVDYELQLEAQKITGNDFFCALTFPVAQSHCTLVLGGWGGTVTGLSCLDGLDASENETTQFIRYEKNRWYRVRVRIADERIQAWLDDRQIVDVPYAGKTIEVRNEVVLSRPLGICSFATTARVRKIQLQDLSKK